MKKTMPRISLAIILILLSTSFLHAQPRVEYVKVVVAPDRSDWTYAVDEQVTFTVSVHKFGNPIDNITVRYEIMSEKMDPRKEAEISLEGGIAIIKGGTMKEPGFLRCRVYAEVDGKQYSAYATAGFDPLEIEPTTENPKDFVKFWDAAKAEASKIPLDTKMTLIPERCTETVNVYHVSIQNYSRNSRVYGIACIPKKEGKYPALLQVPGAGVRGYYGDVGMAEKGMITFQIGIHGVPVTMDSGVYGDLGSAALSGYWEYNLDNRDKYYYKRVYLGCVRAVDFIFSLPQFDGEKLAVTGGSQGGALSIVTAGLDKRVKWLAPYFPALCDLTGYLYGRAGGWPHMFAENNKESNRKDDKIETSYYYDVVNFARVVSQPGYYSWGYNDNVCPPTSMYAAYNVVTVPKKLLVAQDTGHWAYPEQYEITNAWLVNHLLEDGSLPPK